MLQEKILYTKIMVYQKIILACALRLLGLLTIKVQLGWLHNFIQQFMVIN